MDAHRRSQMEVPVSDSLDLEKQVMSAVCCKEEDKNEYVEGKSEVKGKPERRRNFYPEAYDFRRKGVFTCLVCFKRFPSCLKVKKHFVQEHPKAFCALSHENVAEPRVQTKLLLFCPKNCQYATLKMDAFIHHLATCFEPNLGSKDSMENQIDFIAEDDDEDEGEDKHMESPPNVMSKSEQCTTVIEEAQITPLDKLKENHMCAKCNTTLSASHFVECHMKLYHSDKGRKAVPSHKNVSHPHPQKNNQNANAASEGSRCQVKANKEERKPDHPRPVSSSRNDSIHKTLSEGGPVRHSTRLSLRPDSSSTSSSNTNSGTSLYSNCTPARSKCRFTCKKCGMSLNKLQDFHVHMVMHEREKHSNCADEKAQLISSAGNLVTGGNNIYTLSNQHSVINRNLIFECVKCKLCFHQNKDLLAHMKSHRTKVHQCHECGRVFNRGDSLSMHMRTHTGEKPCKCEICGASFRTPGTLRMHLKRHRGDKPFQCSVCGHSFGRRSSLKTHLRIHTGEKPYQCAECGKSFSQSGSLNIHMKIHTGEKPFKCDECGKAFKIRILLKKHMGTHAKEKPYKCGECGREFSNGACFNWHLRSHQKKTPS